MLSRQHMRPEDRVLLNEDGSQLSLRSLRKAQAILGVKDLPPVRNKLTKQQPRTADSSLRRRGNTLRTAEADRNSSAIVLRPNTQFSREDKKIDDEKEEGRPWSQATYSQRLDGSAPALSISNGMTMNSTTAAQPANIMLHRSSSETILKEKSSRKSLHQSKSTMTLNTTTEPTVQSKPTRKLTLSSFFPRPQSARYRLWSPSRFIATPTEMTDANDFFPAHTTRAELKRTTHTGRLEVCPTAPQMDEKPAPSMEKMRPKIFDADEYDMKNVTVKRPPKGIKNWFDGFDSSGEGSSGEEDAASTARDRVEVPSSADTLVNRSAAVSLPLVHDNVHELETPELREKPIDLRHTTSRTTMGSSATVTSTNASAGYERTNEQPTAAPRAADDFSAVKSPELSRIPEVSQTESGTDLPHEAQKLTGRSILNLSDSEEEEVDTKEQTEELKKQNNTASKGNRPRISERRSSITRNGSSTNNTEAHKKRRSRNHSSPTEPLDLSSRRRSISITNNRDSYAESGADRHNERASQPRQKNSQKRQTDNLGRVAKDDSVTPEGSNTESTPRGGPTPEHLVAVTQEEMTILEMLRRRRATLGESTAWETRGVGLRDSMSQLRMGRDATAIATEDAVKRRKHNGSVNRGHGVHDSISSSLSGSIAPGDTSRRRKSILPEELRLSYEQRQELNMIRMKELDAARRIERFLRQHSPTDDQFPTSLPDTHYSAYPSSPQTTSMTPSLFEEAIVHHGRGNSTVQRLTNHQHRISDVAPTRYSYATTFEEESVDDYKDKVKPYADAPQVSANKHDSIPQRSSRDQRKGSIVDSDADIDTSDDEICHDPEVDVPLATSQVVENALAQPRAQHSRMSSKHIALLGMIDTSVPEEEPVPESQDPQTAFRDEEPIITERLVHKVAARLNGSRPSSSLEESDIHRQLPDHILSVPSRWASLNKTSNHRKSLHFDSPPRQRQHIISTARSPTSAPRQSLHISSTMSQGGLPSSTIYNDAIFTQSSPLDEPSAPNYRLSTTPHGADTLSDSTSSTNMPTDIRRNRLSLKAPSLSTRCSQESGKVSSLTSMTSAGEDVLAAWAELGGGGEAYTARRQRQRKAKAKAYAAS